MWGVHPQQSCHAGGSKASSRSINRAWNLNIGTTEWADDSEENGEDIGWDEQFNWLELQNEYTGSNKPLYFNVVEKLQTDISSDQIRNRNISEIMR